MRANELEYPCESTYDDLLCIWYRNRLELSGSVHDAVEAYNSVAKWAKTESAPWSLNFALVGPKIRKEPKGTVLIIRFFSVFLLYSE